MLPERLYSRQKAGDKGIARAHRVHDLHLADGLFKYLPVSRKNSRLAAPGHADDFAAQRMGPADKIVNFRLLHMGTGEEGIADIGADLLHILGSMDIRKVKGNIALLPDAGEARSPKKE